MVKNVSRNKSFVLVLILASLFIGTESEAAPEQGLKISDELTVMLGMVSLSYTENE